MYGHRSSGDTVIKLLKQYFEKKHIQSSDIIGIDDWAIRKGHHYGTIICDGKTNKPLALLEGRDGSELKKWLSQNPHIKTITRDRASAYAKVISEVLPDAMQIADRFHLYQNLLKVVRDAIINEIPNRISIKDQDSCLAEIEQNPDNSKKNDLIRRTEKEEHRRNEILKVQTLLQQGYRPVDIRNQLGYDYRTIRKYAACNPDNLCRNPLKGQQKSSILDPFAEIIFQKLKEGMVLTDIYAYISNDGYEGKRSNFYGCCKRLMEQYNLEYHTQKNIVGSPIHRKKTLWSLCQPEKNH